jgi:nucleotide-binding universal stress UspA family protein
MKTIIFPTDYSDTALEAGKVAAWLAEKFQSKLIFFHSIVNFVQPDTPPEIILEITASIKEKEQERLEKYADEVLRTHAPLLSRANVSYVLEDSFLLVDSLVLACKEQKADLVVMGTTGASGLKKVFMGSNTANFISKSPCDVLAIPHQFSNKFGSMHRFNKVAVGIDLTSPEKEAVRAVNFFRYLADQIDLVHVYPNYPEKVSVKTLKYDELLNKLRHETGYMNLNLFLEKTSEPNQTIEGLQQFKDAYKPEALGVFSVKRSFFDSLFDPSRSVELAYETDIPVVIFPIKPSA